MTKCRHGERAEAAPVVAPRTYIHPSMLTILGTYRCTASCEDCCFGSNPWIAQRLGLPEILAFLEEGSRFSSVRTVVFSGGECFLLGDDLVRAVEFATDKGLRTRCVTNGFWARSRPVGHRRLSQLKDAGLSELNVSTGDYHQKYVPQEAVVNAACLGVSLGFEATAVMVEMQRERRVSAANLLADPRLRALMEGPDRHRLTVVESPWMPMDARRVIAQTGTEMLNAENVYRKERGCKSILTTVVLAPERKIGLCCGLSREMIPELNARWDEAALEEVLAAAGRDFMKVWLFVDGPERILAWAASKNPRIDWKNRFAHHCHACLAIFQDTEVRETVRRFYRERVDDVLLRYSVALREQELLGGASYG